MTRPFRVVTAIARKDILIEWRTKTGLLSALVFAVLILAVQYVARDPTAVSALDIAPAALWITFSFATMIGLNRAFWLERRHRTLDAILLTGASPNAVFAGKFLANLWFVGTVELISIPLFVLFYNVPIWRQLPILLLVIFMATIAIVAIGTVLSSLAVQTPFAELLLPMVLLPFLVPPVVAGVQITARLLAERPLSEISGWLKLLGGFDVLFVGVCMLLFEATLRE